MGMGSFAVGSFVIKYNDFWIGCEYTDNFIKKIDPDFADGTSGEPFPSYNRNESYHKDGLTVGLYKDNV